jgi:dephospho-CoA kinase
MMKRIGLTGGIGSGKSNIAEAFKILGIGVYNSDERAKWLNENDERIVAGLTKLLGNEVYFADGKLNKRYMAGRIFSDKKLLQEVNALIHPIVEEDFEAWCKEQEAKGAKYIINEAALLVENGSYDRYDYLIVVCAPYEQRVTRTMKRDNMTKEQVESRIINQMSDDEKREYADEVILTDDKHFIIPQIMKINNLLNN